MSRRKATHECMFILVRGANSCFVFDMMRYDNACPANEQNAGMLERGCHGHRPKDEPALWIVMKHFVPVGAPREPTADRWRSFGWECDARAFDHFVDAESVANLRNAELKKKASVSP